MSISSHFQTASSQEELCALTSDLLGDWVREFEAGRVPLHIPKGRLRLVPGTHFHLHTELFIQLSGITIFEFQEGKFRLDPGGLCLVPSGIPHKERVRAWRGPFSNLVFMCDPHEIHFHLAHEKAPGRPGGSIGCRLQNTGNLTSLLDQAAELSLTGSEARLPAIKGLMTAYLALLQVALEDWGAPVVPEPFKVSQARQWVMKLLPNPALSVAFLARQLQCNADYLSQLFKTTTGTALQAYISQRRLERARELLAGSTLNISEVSEAAGFHHPSYFSRVFPHWSGVTPREFRANLPKQRVVRYR